MFKASLILSGLVGLLCLPAFANNKGPFPHQRSDHPQSKNMTVGRYLYTGNIPKFKATELELYVSKMALTLRVKAWVSDTKVQNYANELMKRYRHIEKAFNDPELTLFPLNSSEERSEQAALGVQAWLKIAGQYMQHNLDEHGLMIYRPSKKLGLTDQADYKQTILTTLARYYFQRDDLVPTDLNSPAKVNQLINEEASRDLFFAQLGSNFTEDQSRPGYIGFITMLYPITVNAEGPFSSPAEQVTNLILSHSLESRWWSSQWKDEFGGFPFIQITWGGEAFHGPILNQGQTDTWFLGRNYLSHGCFRMDSSDLLEFRMMLPLEWKNQKPVKIIIKNYFDVTDWNNDGEPEVLDVLYYKIPTAIWPQRGQTLDTLVAPYLVSNQMTKFFTHGYARQFYDASNDVLKNIPRYEIKNGLLTYQGKHPEMKIVRFPFRGNRIIQYTEKKFEYWWDDDYRGKYPMKYFNSYE